MTSAAITVVICAYNRSAVLLECLRRLERQTFPDFNVVVMDDGSTDDTFAAAQQFAAKSNLAIEVMTQPNGGLGNARNHAMRYVTAPLTLMLGQDIWPHPQFIERHVVRHEQNPEERLAVLGLSRYFDPSRPITPYERYLETQGGQFSYGHLRDGDRVDWHYFYTGNLSAKTSLLRRYRSQEDIFFLEDAAWGFRITRDGGLTVLYDALAVGDHYHAADVEWSLERAYYVGIHARRLVSDVPALREEFDVRGSALRLRCYRWLAQRHVMWAGVRRVMHRLSQRWAMAWFAGKVLRLHFFAGYEGMRRP